MRSYMNWQGIPVMVSQSSFDDRSSPAAFALQRSKSQRCGFSVMYRRKESSARPLQMTCSQ